MPYVPTSWVDNTTLVNAARMNNIEGGVSAAEVTANKNQPSGYVGLSATSQIVFQGDVLANLYRPAAGLLATDGKLYTSYTTNYAAIGGVGPANVAGVAFLGDTNLYRSAAGVLKTDGELDTGAELVARLGGAGQLILGNYSGSAGIRFGPSQDVTVFRSTTGVTHLETAQPFSANYLCMRYGLDKAVSGGVLSVTSGFHRITGYDAPSLTTISGTSIDGALLILYNISGATLSFNTGSNIAFAFSLANYGRLFLYFNAIQSLWMPISIW